MTPKWKSRLMTKEQAEFLARILNQSHNYSWSHSDYEVVNSGDTYKSELWLVQYTNAQGLLHHPDEMDAFVDGVLQSFAYYQQQHTSTAA
jgi:hypothetical protein